MRDTKQRDVCVHKPHRVLLSFTTKPAQFSSVARSCPTLCDPMDCSTPGLPAHHQACWLTSSQMDLECEERRDEGPKAKAIFTLKFLPTLLLKLSSSQSCAQYSFYKTAHSSGTPPMQGAEWKSLEPHLPLHPTPLGLSFFLYKIDDWDWRGCPPRSALLVPHSATLKESLEVWEPQEACVQCARAPGRGCGLRAPLSSSWPICGPSGAARDGAWRRAPEEPRAAFLPPPLTRVGGVQGHPLEEAPRTSPQVSLRGR